MVSGLLQVVMRFPERSSLASHDRQRKEMEVQGGEVAVGPLWKPSWRTGTSCLFLFRNDDGLGDMLVFAGSQAEQAMSKVEKEKIKRE
jgi:hypothetical protein